MQDFLNTNSDYVFFIHGVFFLFLIIPTLALAKLDKSIRWKWLTIFVAARTIGLWTQISTSTGSTRDILIFIQYAMLSLAVVSLSEFARSTLISSGVRQPGRWILPSLLAAALVFAGAFNIGNLYPVVYYSLALPCGAWAGVAFWVAGSRRQAHAENRMLRLIAVAITGYILALLCSDPAIPLFPRFLLSDPEITNAALRPGIEVIRTLFASVVLISICIYYHRMQKQTLLNEHVHSWTRQRMIWTTMIAGVLMGGWVATHFTGLHHAESMRGQILLRNKIVAAVIPMEKIHNLAWDETDLTNPAYIELKQLLTTIRHANSDIRFALLMGARDGKTFFLADSEPPESKDYSPPGQYYEEAERSYLDAIATHKPFVLGPISDHWGAWISSSVPLGGAATENGSVSLDFDIAAPEWFAQVRGARLPMVLITMLITILMLGGIITQESLRAKAAEVSISEQRNLSMMEGSPDCVMIFDSKGHFEAVNLNGLRALGRSGEAIIGRHFMDIWPESRRADIAAFSERTLNGNPTKFEADYIRPDGRTISWRVATNPVRDQSQSVHGFVAILVDVTESKSNEVSLKAAKEVAESAAKAKGEFLAVMSHEIRTPLGGVIGLLNILLKHPQPPEQRHYTDIAKENAESLLHILDNVLDTAKIESGKLTLEAVPFRPLREFARVIDGMRTRTEAKGLGLQCSINPLLPEILVGDPARLCQIVSNLVSNAIKFTNQGGIEIAIDGIPQEKSGILLKIRVTDTGIGIPEEAQKRIFEKFEQVDASTTRRFGGTGLGLSIVRSLCEMMGGGISIISKSQAGTTFICTGMLGVGTVDQLRNFQSSGNKASATTINTGHLNVLCADDNATHRLIIKLLLQNMGHTAVVVDNGREVVERLRAQHFDVVLLDNRMPIMDGFQATAAIRRPDSDVLNPSIPIIAVTANASTTYRDKCTAAGMNDFLEKPVTEDALRSALAKALKEQPPSAPASGDPGPVICEPVSEPQPCDAIKTPLTGAAPGLSVDELMAMSEPSPAQAAPYNPLKSLSPSALKAITEQYLKETPERIAEMKNCLAALQNEDLARAAHSIKSTSKYVGAMEVSKIAEQIEMLADNDNLAPIRSQLFLLEKAFHSETQRLQTHF